MSTTNLTLTLTLVSCARCAMSFGVPRVFETERRADHATFYCPNGHSNYYPGKTAEQKELERLREDLEYLGESYRETRAEAQAARRSLAATKGVLTRTRNRIAAGKCPHCRAEFPDLAAHIQAEHAPTPEEES